MICSDVAVTRGSDVADMRDVARECRVKMVVRYCGVVESATLVLARLHDRFITYNGRSVTIHQTRRHHSTRVP